MMQDLMYIGWPIVLPFIVAVISLFLLFNNVPHRKGHKAGNMASNVMMNLRRIHVLFHTMNFLKRRRSTTEIPLLEH